MPSVKAILSAGLVATVALARPHHAKSGFAVLEARQANGAVCGSDKYSAANVAAAQKVGCQYENQGKTVGTDSYPHQYNDFEGFNFTTPSPWYEYPIMASHSIFSGSGSPGADRVIFNKACQLTGVITHTGASGDNFVMCKYDGSAKESREEWGM